MGKNKDNGGEDATPDDKSVGIIPDVFYDIFCRVIPGFIVIIICHYLWPDVFFESFGNTENKILIPMLVVVSWAIGITLEIVPVVIWQRLRPTGENTPGDPTLTFTVYERRAMIRFHAECTFFRSMCVVSFCCFCYVALSILVRLTFKKVADEKGLGGAIVLAACSRGTMMKLGFFCLAAFTAFFVSLLGYLGKRDQLKKHENNVRQFLAKKGFEELIREFRVLIRNCEELLKNLTSRNKG